MPRLFINRNTDAILKKLSLSRKVFAFSLSCLKCQDENTTLKNLLKGEIATQEDEEDNVQVLCCSFQRYLHCSEQVVNSTCGSHTAGFTKQFLDRMSGPLVQQHCQHYEHGSDMCPDQPRDHVSQSPRYQEADSGSSAHMHVPMVISFVISVFLLLNNS